MRARNLFVQALRKIRERYKFLLVGYVVMPNHVHLLISETSKATPSLVLKVLKQRTSRNFRAVPRRALKGQFTLRVCERCGGAAAFLAAAVKPQCGAPASRGDNVSKKARNLLLRWVQEA